MIRFTGIIFYNKIINRGDYYEENFNFYNQNISEDSRKLA